MKLICYLKCNIFCHFQNLSKWKSNRRKSAHLPLDDLELEPTPEEDTRKAKTFSQIMAEK